MVVMGPKHAALLGVKVKEYLPAKTTHQVADNRKTRVLGMAILKITTMVSNRTTRQQAYIMEAGNLLYFSHQAFQDLGCPSENYPEAEVTNEKGNLGQMTEMEEKRPCDSRTKPCLQTRPWRCHTRVSRRTVKMAAKPSQLRQSHSNVTDTKL